MKYIGKYKQFPQKEKCVSKTIELPPEKKNIDELKHMFIILHNIKSTNRNPSLNSFQQASYIMLNLH